MDRQQQVRDFLEKTVKDLGLSLNSLSLRLGKNSTYLFHFIKRNSPKRLDETTRRKLASILNVSEQNLCDYPLPSNLVPDKLDTISQLFNLSKNKHSNLISIDVIDMSGNYSGRFDKICKNIIGQEFFSSEVYKSYSSASPENIKIIKVSGDAMSPFISAGDFIWLDTSFSTPSTDGIYLINSLNDVIIRRIQINPIINSIEVSADNPHYKSFATSNYKDLDICGKVISILHHIN